MAESCNKTESASESPAAKPKKKVNRGARMGKGPGRPTKRTALDVAHAKQLAAEGKSFADIALALGIGQRTVYTWFRDNEQFRQAVEEGKSVCDGLVERSLFERATGYSHDEERIFCQDGAVIRAKTTKHYPPDTMAIAFYLKNRKPDQWKDKQEVEHSGSIDLVAGLLACRQRAGMADAPEGGA